LTLRRPIESTNSLAGFVTTAGWAFAPTGRQKIASRRARDSGAVREPTTAEIRPFRRKPDAAAR
jgi:hypothetical protein